MKVLGNKVYDVCAGCGQIVRQDKLLFGSLHFCATPEEQRLYRSNIKKMYLLNKKRLEKSQ